MKSVPVSDFRGFIPKLCKIQLSMHRDVQTMGAVLKVFIVFINYKFLMLLSLMGNDDKYRKF